MKNAFSSGKDSWKPTLGRKAPFEGVDKAAGVNLRKNLREAMGKLAKKKK